MQTGQQSGGDAVSKGEFARLCRVTPGRVSQWLSEGKIHGRAIVGEGRSARIDPGVARAQLDRTLDISQRLGNGLHTDLGPPVAAPPAPQIDTDPPEPPVNSVRAQIEREKLEQLQRANREGARQEAIAAGMLTDAGVVRQQIGREIGKLVTRFESALADFATATAAQFKVPQRDVLHLLRSEYRKFRAAEAEIARTAAEAQPPSVPFDLADPDSQAPAGATRGAAGPHSGPAPATVSAATPSSSPAPPDDDAPASEDGRLT